MECTQTEWLSNADYLRQFNRKVAELRIPLSGSIDLTHRCNLRCVHCYLGSRAGRDESDHQELSTAKLLSIIDEITDAGCLNLLITGGEPLLRKDFGEVFRHAKRNGLLVTVFTNGTLITDEVLEIFSDLPPQQVEISLYGATAETYEKITGVAGSFERCLEGIHRLLACKLNVRLKTILMTLNRHEFFDIEKMARDFGVKFRFDAAIFPRFDGDKTPLQLRVPAKEAVEKELCDKDRLRQWRLFFERFQGVAPTDSLYECGAGMTTFHVDPYGTLQPCLMTTEPTYDLLNGSFLAGWRDVMPRIRQKRPGSGYACNACEKKLLCGFCPAFFALENGAEDVRSEYLCAMGHLRFQAITNAQTATQQVGDRNEFPTRAREQASLREAEA
jgi:radical SAM protein with 4Fe4S-binding SPASM domain